MNYEWASIRLGSAPASGAVRRALASDTQCVINSEWFDLGWELFSAPAYAPGKIFVFLKLARPACPTRGASDCTRGGRAPRKESHAFVKNNFHVERRSLCTKLN